MRLASCGDDSVLDLDRTTNPTCLRIPVGSDEDDEYFGALIGSNLLVFTVWLPPLALYWLLPSLRPKFIAFAIRIHTFLVSGITTTSVFVMAYLNTYSFVGVFAMVFLIVTTSSFLFKVFYPGNFHAFLIPVPPKEFDRRRPILSVVRFLTRRDFKWETIGGDEFVEKFGVLFSSFREGREWYIFVELANTMTLSIFLGIVTLPCWVLNVINVIAQAVDLLLIVTLRPHHTFRDYVMDVIVYVAKLLMAILGVLPPRHPFRHVCEVAGYVVLASGVKDFVFFFLRLYVTKQDKDETARAQFIRPEDDEDAPLDAYVPPTAFVVMPPPVDVVNPHTEARHHNNGLDPLERRQAASPWFQMPTLSRCHGCKKHISLCTCDEAEIREMIAVAKERKSRHPPEMGEGTEMVARPGAHIAARVFGHTTSSQCLAGHPLQPSAHQEWLCEGCSSPIFHWTEGVANLCRACCPAPHKVQHADAKVKQIAHAIQKSLLLERQQRDSSEQVQGGIMWGKITKHDHPLSLVDQSRCPVCTKSYIFCTCHVAQVCEMIPAAKEFQQPRDSRYGHGVYAHQHHQHHQHNQQQQHHPQQQLHGHHGPPPPRPHEAYPDHMGYMPYHQGHHHQQVQRQQHEVPATRPQHTQGYPMHGGVMPGGNLGGQQQQQASRTPNSVGCVMATNLPWACLDCHRVNPHAIKHCAGCGEESRFSYMPDHVREVFGKLPKRRAPL